jgi:hypothetical protein
MADSLQFNALIPDTDNAAHQHADHHHDGQPFQNGDANGVSPQVDMNSGFTD